jgi:hypothetical protein
MAKIVLGIGTSHTPMLNAPLADWPRFIERDKIREHLTKDGRSVSYSQLEELADPGLIKEINPEVFAVRHAAAARQVEHVGKTLREARLDALVIVGDDQKELYDDDNMPSILVYRGESIRNVPLREHPGPDWAAAASARYFETEKPHDYPVDADLSMHLIDHLIDNGFDIACADSLADGYGEGHAFGFVHNRLLNGATIPVVPIFLNTYYPPNQPTPARCHQLGTALRDALQSYPSDMRVGVLASGGLSHFTVDEVLDAQVIDALRANDTAALRSLPRAQLNSGNSEIRNWICMAAAVDHLALRSLEYIPAYRTRAGTGTGLCFAVWE